MFRNCSLYACGNVRNRQFLGMLVNVESGEKIERERVELKRLGIPFPISFLIFTAGNTTRRRLSEGTKVEECNIESTKIGFGGEFL